MTPKEDTIVDLIVKNLVWLLKDKCHNSRFYCLKLGMTSKDVTIVDSIIWNWRYNSRFYC